MAQETQMALWHYLLFRASPNFEYALSELISCVHYLLKVQPFPNCWTAHPTTCTWPSSLTLVSQPLASTWSTQVWGETACQFVCRHFVSMCPSSVSFQLLLRRTQNKRDSWSGWHSWKGKTCSKKVLGKRLSLTTAQSYCFNLVFWWVQWCFSFTFFEPECKLWRQITGHLEIIILKTPPNHFYLTL